MKHISKILEEIPAVAMTGQHCKVSNTRVNPAKCKAKSRACHPSDFFGGIEECKACKRKF